MTVRVEMELVSGSVRTLVVPNADTLDDVMKLLDATGDTWWTAEDGSRFRCDSVIRISDLTGDQRTASMRSHDMRVGRR